MARPTTKLQLIDQSEENIKKLFGLINSLTVDEQEKSFSFEIYENLEELADEYKIHEQLK